MLGGLLQGKPTVLICTHNRRKSTQWRVENASDGSVTTVLKILVEESTSNGTCPAILE